MDECLSIGEKLGDIDIGGQYCMVHINLPLMNKSNVVDYTKKVDFHLKDTALKGTVYEMFANHMELMMYTPTTFRFGVCFPSACSRFELQTYLDQGNCFMHLHQL